MEHQEVVAQAQTSEEGEVEEVVASAAVEVSNLKNCSLCSAITD